MRQYTIRWPWAQVIAVATIIGLGNFIYRLIKKD